METKSALTETLQEKLLGFFDSHDIHLFSQNLRRQFIHYLEYELRTGVPLYFDKFLYPFNDLLDLLDTVGDELKQFNSARKIHKQAALKNNSTREKVIAFLKASFSPEKIFLLHENEIPNRVGNDGRVGHDVSVGNDGPVRNDVRVENGDWVGNDGRGGIPNQVGNDGRVGNDVSVGNDDWLGNDGEVHDAINAENAAYFDLMVVIPDGAQTSFSYYEQVISMANIDGAVINVSLHQSAALHKQLREGHIYYSIVCNERNLIYDNGLTKLPEVNKTLLQAVYEKANTTFYNSHKKANSFLEGANDYYGAHELNMTAFMLHQSIELALRGMITALLGSCAKTHCFRELKKPLKRCAPELQYLLSANAAEEGRLLHLLEKAYLESRYADTLDISDNDIALLVEGAESLHERVEKIFKEKMQAIDN